MDLFSRSEGARDRGGTYVSKSQHASLIYSSSSSFASSSSPSSTSSSHSLKNVHISDALELAWNILETVSEMIEDTESVVDRILFITADDNRNLKRMLKVIVGSTMTRISEKEKEDEEEEEEEERQEEETRFLRDEGTTSAACLLYRLCEMVKYSSAEEGVDLRKLLQILSEDSQAPKFYEAILRQIFRRIMIKPTTITNTTTTTTMTSMTATEAIAFFHRFSVLNFTLLYNPKLAKYIRENFCEEFRYYIELKKIRALIPARFPIHSPTLALVQRVTNAVFQGSV